MSAHDRAVQDQVLHIGVISEMGVHLPPHPGIAPAGIPFVDAIPIAIAWREIAPGCPGTADPEHGLHEAAAVCFGAQIDIGAGVQEIADFLPLVIA
jgi:hypothetical protein